MKNLKSQDEICFYFIVVIFKSHQNYKKLFKVFTRSTMIELNDK